MTPPVTRNITTKLQITCQNCSLSDLCIPRGLSQKDVERIGNIVARRKILQKGDFLYRQGDRFRGILAIKAGTAKLVSLDLDGNEFITGYFLPGELLGFDGLADERHACSALALETLTYCEIPAEQIDTLCREVPNLLRELFRHVGRTLTTETDHFMLSQKGAEERVTGFLLDLSDRLSRRGFSGAEIKLTFSRHDIGKYLGLTLETVSRILKKLDAMGLVAVNARSIHIIDKDKLREMFATSSKETF
ncbi:MAG: helix-turn-helix domain-containing protein [Candidatus Methylumidiphilus sp.]